VTEDGGFRTGAQIERTKNKNTKPRKRLVHKRQHETKINTSGTQRTNFSLKLNKTMEVTVLPLSFD
jgi:hypothetical protein